MTSNDPYAFLKRAASEWYKANATKSYLRLVSATAQHAMQGNNYCTASNDLIETRTLTMTATVLPPDEGYSYFDPSPAQIAARISALSVASTLIMAGDALPDKRLAQDVCLELMETAAWLARQLAKYHDAEDRQ